MGRIGDKRAVEPLIEALKDEDEGARWLAAEALKKITGNDFGEDYEEWRKWYEKQK